MKTLTNYDTHIVIVTKNFLLETKQAMPRSIPSTPGCTTTIKHTEMVRSVQGSVTSVQGHTKSFLFHLGNRICFNGLNKIKKKTGKTQRQCPLSWQNKNTISLVNAEPYH